MAADFPYLYPHSYEEAQELKEVHRHTESFRENVSCALAIERALRGKFNAEDGVLTEGCAQSVLEQYGFKRVRFILANSIQQMDGGPGQISGRSRQWLQQVYVPSDEKYNLYLTVNAAAPLLEAFISQTQAAYQALGLFGSEHCTGIPYELDYQGEVLVLSSEALRESCWNLRNQLWLGESGFGCSPHAIGQAVYATCLGDGEQARWNRTDFVGVLDETYLPDWARESLEAIHSQRQERRGCPSMDGMS